MIRFAEAFPDAEIVSALRRQLSRPRRARHPCRGVPNRASSARDTSRAFTAGNRGCTKPAGSQSKLELRNFAVSSASKIAAQTCESQKITAWPKDSGPSSRSQ
jgi:hypothetical protein